MIKAITFDLWNTLLEIKEYANSRIYYIMEILNDQKVSCNYQIVEEAYFSFSHHRGSKDENYRYITVFERVNQMLNKLKIKLSRESINQIIKGLEEIILKNPPPLIKGSRKTLDQLFPLYKIALISDSGFTPGRALRKVLKHHRVLDFFKTTIFSDETGFNKPHSIMFEYAIKGLGVEPSEVIHVGDLFETDIIGAKSYGIKTIWINKLGIKKQNRIQADYEVNNLSQIISIIKGGP